MAFLGLELNVGLTVSLAVAILAAFWNYSSLSDIRWTEITAGVMAFVAGGGLQYMLADNALGALASVPASAGQVTAALYLIGGLLLLVGGILNGIQLLQRQYG